MAGRVTQQPVRVLVVPTSGKARVTTQAVRVLVAGATVTTLPLTTARTTLVILD